MSDPTMSDTSAINETAGRAGNDWRGIVRPRPSVVALGNFDGVHLGHRRILDAVAAAAAEAGADAVALTFEPHPRQFLFPDAKTSLLTSPREKTALIRALGVEPVTLAFDASLAALEASGFVNDVLLGRLRGTRFFLGGDHRFGKGARGDAGLLRDLARRALPESAADDPVVLVPPVIDGGEPVSSSAIRHHLKDGRIERANALLDRAYAVRGTVVPGAARGRLIGFPTANLQPEDARKILPFGVFGGFAVLDDGTRHVALANVGLRPTFNEPGPSLEVHLPGWSGDLYGRALTFEFRTRLRPEQKFDSIEALRDQIARDVATWQDLAPTFPRLPRP